MKLPTVLICLALISPTAQAWTFGKLKGKSSGYWTAWTLINMVNHAGIAKCEYHRYWINRQTHTAEKEQNTTTDAIYNSTTRFYECQAPKD